MTLFGSQQRIVESKALPYNKQANLLEGRFIMKLYLVQHGKAAAEETDPLRPLTEEGRKDVLKVAEYIKPLSLCVDCLWHSSKTRAEQTAKILASVIKSNKGTMQRQGLAPNDDVAALKDELLTTENDIMIVGHLPFLGKLASLLTVGCESAEVVEFKQGGILCLNRCEDKKWHIGWIITPEFLATVK
jgi:phosphohistidine phosphatase